MIDTTKVMEFFNASEKVRVPVHVVGCGAIGSHVCEQLTRLGMDEVHIWDFDKARFRGAPQAALRLTYTDPDGTEQTVESDERFVTAPSPVLFDDYRFGEHYDARLELPGWNAPGFDDSGWQPALPAPMPRGEARLCEAEPIVVTDELKPVSILPEGDGYRYDFGKNCAGVCRLTIRGRAGQRVELLHGEYLEDGKLTVRNIWFGDNPLVHRDVYICKGEGEETYTPSFTYHGFQYVLVTGITPEQATPDLLTYVVMNSDLKERGGFTASAEDLYVGASMILTPDKRTDMRLLETLKAFFLDLGFAGLTFSTPEEHDRIIAFTSQLAHIVSSAYVKSPEAQKRRGFSAGSFQDMTRVARLDEAMWTELFLDDEDFLTAELEELIGHLTDYRNALRAKDTQRLHDLLTEGRELKATAGGN